MENFDLRKYLAEGKINEGSFDELKKNQKMMNDAADYFRKKAYELNINLGAIGDFNGGINNLLDLVFKADYKRSKGKID